MTHAFRTCTIQAAQNWAGPRAESGNTTKYMNRNKFAVRAVRTERRAQPLRGPPGSQGNEPLRPQARDTLATVPARVVAENTAHEHDGYVLRPAKNGGKSIEEIFFSGAKYDLKIQPAGKSS
jgi:hypothetical protein